LASLTLTGKTFYQNEICQVSSVSTPNEASPQTDKLYSVG
jgi:hypothetical protein